MRNKTNDGIVRLDRELKTNARQLYYEKKADLYSMMKEKKRLDEINIEELLKKTQIPVNFNKKQ